MEDNIDAVNLLIEHGASQFVKTNDGDTPRQLLKSKGKKLSVARAINDNAKGGIDLLGFRAYAKGIHNTVMGAELPLCVGLIAQWGYGKLYVLNMLSCVSDELIAMQGNRF